MNKESSPNYPCAINAKAEGEIHVITGAIAYDVFLYCT